MDEHTPFADIPALSPRIRQALAWGEIKTLGELAKTSDEVLLALPNFGPRCLQAVHLVLRQAGWKRDYATSKLNRTIEYHEQQIKLLRSKLADIEGE